MWLLNAMVCCSRNELVWHGSFGIHVRLVLEKFCMQLDMCERKVMLGENI